jgi:hypothetical protein
VVRNNDTAKRVQVAGSVQHQHEGHRSTTPSVTHAFLGDQPPRSACKREVSSTERVTHRFLIITCNENMWDNDIPSYLADRQARRDIEHALHAWDDGWRVGITLSQKKSNFSSIRDHGARPGFRAGWQQRLACSSSLEL